MTLPSLTFKICFTFSKNMKRGFLSLEELIKYVFPEYKLIQNALITLEVNFDRVAA